MTEAQAKRPSARLLWTLVGLMVVFWTLNPIFGKVALRHVPPPLLVAVRTSLAALFVLIALRLGSPRRRPIARKDWPLLLLLGPVLQVGNQMLFVIGLSRTSVAHTVLIFSTAPIVILCLGAALRHERITARKIVGMLISAAGVIWLSTDRGDGGIASASGDALLLVAILFFSSFTVFGKGMRERYGSTTVNAVAYVGGAIALQPLIWFVYADVSLRTVPAAAWWSIGYMALFPAVIGYLIYHWALTHVPASRIAALQYLQPPLAAGLGWLMLGEAASWTLAGAGAVILAGVYLTERG